MEPVSAPKDPTTASPQHTPRRPASGARVVAVASSEPSPSLQGRAVQKDAPDSKVRTVFKKADPFDEEDEKDEFAVRRPASENVLRVQDLMGPAAISSSVSVFDSSIKIRPMKHSPEYLARITFPPQISSIDCSYIAVTDGHLSTLVKKIPTVKSLFLFFCSQLTNRAIEELGALPELEELNMGACSGLTGDLFSSLPANSFPRLKRLICSGTKITDNTLQQIAQFPLLASIDISCCLSVTDEGFLALGKMASLRKIILIGNSISPATIQQFRLWYRNIKLEGAGMIGDDNGSFSVESAVAAHPSLNKVDLSRPESCFFLRCFLFSHHKILTWSQVEHLLAYEGSITSHYMTELQTRDIQFESTGSVRKDWIAMETALQKADGPHLMRIMPVIEDQLRGHGYYSGSLPSVWDVLWDLMTNKNVIKLIKKLDLQNKELTKIPPYICNLKWQALEILLLNHNNLTDFPFFPFCSALRIFEVSHNKVASLPDKVLVCWPGITLVSLAHNKIASLPLNWGLPNATNNLVIINCSHNCIHQVEKTMLDQLGILEPAAMQLDLSNNPVTMDQIPKLPANVMVICDGTIS